MLQHNVGICQFCCTIRKPLLGYTTCVHTNHNVVVAKLSCQSGETSVAVECWHLQVLTTRTNVVYRHEEILGDRPAQNLKRFVLAARWVPKLGQKWWLHFPHQKWCHYFHRISALIWRFLLNFPNFVSYSVACLATCTTCPVLLLERPLSIKPIASLSCSIWRATCYKWMLTLAISPSVLC